MLSVSLLPVNVEHVNEVEKSSFASRRLQHKLVGDCCVAAAVGNVEGLK